MTTRCLWINLTKRPLEHRQLLDVENRSTMSCVFFSSANITRTLNMMKLHMLKINLMICTDTTKGTRSQSLAEAIFRPQGRPAGGRWTVGP